MNIIIEYYWTFYSTIRFHLLQGLKDWVAWIEGPPPLTNTHVISVPKDDLYKRAEALVKSIEDTVGSTVSGEWKRHQVLAALLKEFPGKARQAGVAIEAALHNLTTPAK